MSSLYYKVIASILLFPWAILVVTIVGNLHARLAHRARNLLGKPPD